MARKPHAEIAGAGIAGLVAAAALAQRGWSVRVHESDSELREIGSGLMAWSNGLWALEQIGAFDEATRDKEVLDTWELYDERGELIQKSWMRPEENELYGLLRETIHQAIAKVARDAGVDIVTSSRVVGAYPDGRLVLRDGSELRGDLILGADGFNSRVRASLDLGAKVRSIPDGCARHLIPRRDDDPRGRAQEHWDGGRRLGIFPCSPEWIYIYLCCPARDVEGREQTWARDTWKKSFPELAEYVDRTSDGARWSSFIDVRLRRWSQGRAAVVGDSAHAMTPNLGQGACVAMLNAVTLAMAMEHANNDVQEGLALWERTQRKIVDDTQRYSLYYGAVGIYWPRRLLPLRSALLSRLGKAQRLQRRVNAVTYYKPPLA